MALRWAWRLRRMARVLGRDGVVLYFALRDPRTPRSTRAAIVAAFAYVLSPIDLVPDVPLVGWADDAAVLGLLLPWLVRRLPTPVREAAQSQAEALLARWWGKPAAARAVRARGSARVRAPRRRPPASPR